MDELIAFLVIVGILIIGMYPWLLIIVGVLLVAFIVLAILSPSKGSGGYGGSYRTYSPSPSGGVQPSSASDEGLLYRGSMASGFVLATYRDGKVFEGYNSGLNLSFYDGSYEYGYIYKGANVVGRYENGYIYRGGTTFYSDVIGRYGDGYIYSGTVSTHITGVYTGSDAGAAAAALLFLL